MHIHRKWWRKKSKENGTEIYIYIYIYLELAYSKSLLVVEKTMRAISASQRVDSSWAFLKRPFLLFENVTCLAFMLSIFLIGIFFLAILILLYIQLHTFHNWYNPNCDPIYIDIRVLKLKTNIFLMYKYHRTTDQGIYACTYMRGFDRKACTMIDLPRINNKLSLWEAYEQGKGKETRTLLK